MKKLAPLVLLGLLAGCGKPADQSDSASNAGASAGGSGGARAQVWAAGSSTVFPFATRVAETVARKTGGAAAKVESLGTGGGIKLFCGGTGSGFPDIANASRPMKASEFEACAKNGVTEIVEIKFGFDGIVIANARTGPDFALTLEDVYRGLAAEVPSGSGFALASAKTWKDVRPALPAQRIVVYGPPPTSGTRDAFVELAMEGGASKIEALKALKGSDEAAFKKRTGTLRSDGGWIDSGENDNAIIGTLTKTPDTLGVFGYSFLEENADKVKGASIDGVKPTAAAIANGSYPLSRSLYIYVKKANLPVIPGLKDFIAEFVSDAASGKGGYLAARGLIPLPDDQRAIQKKAAADLPAMTKPAK
jgi:phosphate transport system substrate-binding protein